MNILKSGILCVLSAFAMEGSAQNLLNLNDWVTGNGGTAGFTPNGLVTENEREWGVGPQGRQVVLWKGTPSGDQNGDGGWNSADIPVNHQKTYRFSVWIKRTNSKSGTAYFGCGAGVTSLAGVVNNNAYFGMVICLSLTSGTYLSAMSMDPAILLPLVLVVSTMG